MTRLQDNNIRDILKRLKTLRLWAIPTSQRAPAIRLLRICAGLATLSYQLTPPLN